MVSEGLRDVLGMNMEPGHLRDSQERFFSEEVEDRGINRGNLAKERQSH